MNSSWETMTVSRQSKPVNGLDAEHIVEGEAESSGQPLAQPQADVDRDESLHAKIVMAMAELEKILGDETKIGNLRKSKYAHEAEMAKGWIQYLQGHLDAVQTHSSRLLDMS